MSRPRLAHIMHHDGAGGGPVVLTQLLQGLDGDFDQAAWCGGRGRVAETCASLGLPFHELSLFPLWKSAPGFFQLWTRLRAFRPDLVFLHGQWAGPLGALAAALAGNIPCLYVAHCPAFYHSTTLWRAIRNYIAEKIPCRLSARVITLSEGNHYNYLFRGWAPEANLVRIPNGIDASAIPPPEKIQALRDRHHWTPGSRHAVFVGRLDDQKRVDWLIEAWALRPAATSSDAHLWIVGDGGEREACEELARQRGLSGSVHFVGSQPDGMTWIAAADLVVMSSMYEGHALVPLEAMACGKPVAAFATDGITDSVVSGQTGLLCELGDTAALGRNISRLLNDEATARAWGEQGRRRVVEHFPLALTLSRYRNLISSLLTHEKPQTAGDVAHP